MNNPIILFENKDIKLTFETERPKDILELNQTHSKQVCQIEELGKSPTGEDGVIFSSGNTKKVAIKTADCVPICFIGKDQIAMVHAGWRGIKQEIHLDQKITKIKPHTIVSGPSICDSCFQVTSEFRDEFPDHQNYFYKNNEDLFFKIKLLMKNQLELTYPQSKLIISTECTLCRPDLHSYRRDKTIRRNYTVFQKR